MTPMYRVLLVESDDYSIHVLRKSIKMNIPCVEVDPVTPAASIAMLEDKAYDIIVCDAFLRHDDRIAFVGDLCQKAGIFLIIITGDTDLKPDTFSPHLATYIHDILYKPLDIKALLRSLHCAIERVKTKREGTERQR